MKDAGTHDLGSGFSWDFFSWDPDRELNPQYDGIASVEKAGIIIYKDGHSAGMCHFDLPEVRAYQKSGPFWQLVSLDPLHIEPSIQMYDYKDGKHVPSHHGFIRDGKWVNA